jgi:hypothetical protein
VKERDQAIADRDRVIADLQAQVNTKPATSDEDAKWKEFKILTKEEFNDLDLSQQQEYLLDKDAFRDYQSRREESSKRKAENDRRLEEGSRLAAQVINASRDAMAEEIPGIFENEEVAAGLFTFAKEHGISEELLQDLTDPATQIRVKGEDGKYGKPRYLAKGSVHIAKALHDLRVKLSNVGKLTETRSNEGTN